MPKYSRRKTFCWCNNSSGDKVVWLIGAGRPILFWILELLIPLSEEERAPIAWQFRFLEHREGKKSSTLVNPTFRTVAPISMAVPTAPSKSSFLWKTILNSRCTSLRYFPLLSSSIKPAVLLYALCLVGTFYAATWSWGWTPMSMCVCVSACVCVCVRQARPCGSTVDLPCLCFTQLNSVSDQDTYILFLSSNTNSISVSTSQ